MAFPQVIYLVTSSNGLSLISGSHIAPGESFWFNTTAGNTYFSGSVIASKLSGSLTTLANGLSYLVAGSNITITSQSNGSVTIDAASTGNNLWFSTTNLTSSNSGSLEVSGSIFSKGVITASLGFSGSLTRLANGLSYLVAGTNITITSASNGSITITGDSTGNTLWFSTTNLTSSNSGSLEVSGSIFSKGAITASLGFSGSLTRLANGLSYLVAGTNITITSQSNGSITIDAAAGSGNNLWYSIANLTSSNSGAIEVSGSATVKQNLSVTGTSVFTGGLSGSLTTLANGNSYLVAGSNVTITSASNGSVTISSTGGSGTGDNAASYLVLSATASLTNERVLTAGPGITFVDGGAGNTLIISASAPRYQFVGPYTATTSTSSSPQVCGQFEFVPTDHLPLFIRFKTVLFAQTATASIRLYNLTSGAYVDLGGTAATILSSSASTPTTVTSQNLVGVGGWSSGTAMYEIRLHSSNISNNVFLGSAYIISSTS
jgi:hypothetical protein